MDGWMDGWIDSEPTLDAIERARQAPRHESILEEVRRENQIVAVQKASNCVSAAHSAPCLLPLDDFATQ